MLCANEALGMDIDCPVNNDAGELFCAKISNVRLDIGPIPKLVEPILRKLVNPPDNNAMFDIIAVPLSILDLRIPGLSDVAGTKINLLDIAETFLGKECGAPTVRIVLGIWRGMQSLAKLFASADEDGILLARECLFKASGMRCYGGAIDLAEDIRAIFGSREMLELAQRMEEVFPTYDLSGERITTVHTHYRRLNAACATTFVKPACYGTCLNCASPKLETECKVKQLQCKGEAATGVMFPFSKLHVMLDRILSRTVNSILSLPATVSEPASVLNYFVGGDFIILEFRPPTLEFIYSVPFVVPL